MERDDVLKIFHSEDFSAITEDEVKAGNRWICSVLLEDLNILVENNKTQIQNFVNILFECLLEKHGTCLRNDLLYFKLKYLYRLFVNTSARSGIFKEICLEKLTIVHWMAILRFDDLISETSYAVCCFGKDLYQKYLLESKFFDFVTELAVICNNNTQDHVNSSLKAFFWKMYEECPCFLVEGFHSLDNEGFIYILGILDELIENNFDTDLTHVKVHENNVFFMLSLIERWCHDDFNEAKSLSLPLFATRILGTLGIHKSNYNKDIFTNNGVLKSLKVILENILAVQDETGTIPVLSEKFKSLCNINNGIYVPINELKVNCLRLITNMTIDDKENKIFAGEAGLLKPVVQCSLDRTTYDAALEKEWSVICLRALTENCPENQNILCQIRGSLNDPVSESLEDKTI